MHALRTEYPLVRLAGVLAVSLSGYNAWCLREEERLQQGTRSAHAEADAALSEQVQALFAKFSQSYGSPRIYNELKGQQVRCSRKRVARLMRQEGLVARPQRRPKPPCVHLQGVETGGVVAPNLLNRDFAASAPNQKWVSDFTYVPTAEGWVYMAVVIDLFSRKVVGWNFGASMTSSLPLAALTMAIQQRQPPAGCLVHSDRGSQYLADIYQAALASRALTVSMSRCATCYDNAVAEAFFSSYKAEVVELAPFATRRQAIAASFAWVEGHYNPRRQHSTLGHISPDQFEANHHRACLLADGAERPVVA
jgi:transposase InsO family protein